MGHRGRSAPRRHRSGRPRLAVRGDGGSLLIAVDTNVLVYAHRSELPKHPSARAWLIHLAEGELPWGLPVFCLGEFVRVVTHRRIFDPPSTIAQATAAIEALLDSPCLRLLSPGPLFVGRLLEALRLAEASGNLAFDAQIAAACREHGVDRLLTDDRDFSRFPTLRVIPLDAAPGEV